MHFTYKHIVKSGPEKRAAQSTRVQHIAYRESVEHSRYFVTSILITRIVVAIPFALH
jgi:hypothetical protein